MTYEVYEEREFIFIAIKLSNDFVNTYLLYPSVSFDLYMGSF